MPDGGRKQGQAVQHAVTPVCGGVFALRQGGSRWLLEGRMPLSSPLTRSGISPLDSKSLMYTIWRDRSSMASLERLG